MPRFDEFIKLFNELINQTDNYVLKRNSLKLLSEFILDREYFHIMMAYVSGVENLKVVMCALRVAAPNIQFEAFHVFKVFVANPQKTPKIAAILAANKGKLISFLRDFQNDKGAFGGRCRAWCALCVRALTLLSPSLFLPQCIACRR